MKPLLNGHDAISVSVPDGPGRDGFVALLREEAAELVVELGAELHFGASAPGSSGQLEFVIDPSARAPELTVEQGARRVVARGRSLDDCATALHLLRTLRRTRDETTTFTPAPTAADAIERLDAEIETTWPSFATTSIDWGELSQEFRPSPRDPDLIGAMQRWVARLGDGHTNVHPHKGIAALPYSARVREGRLFLEDVPDGTAAWESGVRRGDEVLSVDVADLWARAGAPTQLKPWLVGRRALSGLVGEPLELAVRRADGSTVTLGDVPGHATWPRPIEHLRLGSGTGYLRIRRWLTDDADAIDTALTDRAPRLIVDLRGNAGGTLVAASAFRRRFLPRATRVGAVCFSVGDGSLAPPAFYDDEPSERTRWGKPVRFITDALTYSASEDAILGLGQLDHVEVVGEPSGGGSGRPRTVPLLGESLLTVSTALTYDHAGRCVERTGIHVDRPLPVDDQIINRADTAW